MDGEEKLALGVLGALGISFGLGVSFSSCIYGTQTFEAKIYQRENKPAVMRIMKNGRDTILIQDEHAPNHYERLDIYLNRIEDQQERDIEEIRVKQAIEGWY